MGDMPISRKGSGTEDHHRVIAVLDRVPVRQRLVLGSGCAGNSENFEGKCTVLYERKFS